MASIELAQVLRGTALLLDAVLYDGNETYCEPRAGPQRYIFMTSPLDQRLWMPGDDVELVCLTDNKAQTFWSYVAERKNDGDLATQTLQWSNRPRMADGFGGLHIATLPGGGRIHIQHAPLPAHFDLSLVGAYGVPDYQQGSSVSQNARRRLGAVREALDVQRNVSDKVLCAYKRLREWAENAGHFSKDFGPLDSERLVRLVLKLKESSDIEHAFFSAYDGMTMDAVKAKSQSASNDDEDIDSNRPAYNSAMEENATRFCQDFKYYLQVKCRCWDHSRQVAVWPHLVKTAKSLQLALAATTSTSTSTSYTLRVWPMPFKPATTDTDAATSTESVLLCGIRLAVHSKAGDASPDIQASVGPAPRFAYCVRHLLIVEQLTAQLEAYTMEHWPELERETDLTAITIESSEALQTYTALPLPSMSDDREDPPRTTPTNLASTAAIAEIPKLKLRTAGQTMSRLRWDPGHRSVHYEVGYLDRFDGLKWLRLEDWGRPVEEDDFIPEHRIQQFRNAKSGQIVWDRASKTDLTGQM